MEMFVVYTVLCNFVQVVCADMFAAQFAKRLPSKLLRAKLVLPDVWTFPSWNYMLDILLGIYKHNNYIYIQHIRFSIASEMQFCLILCMYSWEFIVLIRIHHSNSDDGC